MEKRTPRKRRTKRTKQAQQQAPSFAATRRRNPQFYSRRSGDGGYDDQLA